MHRFTLLAVFIATSLLSAYSQKKVIYFCHPQNAGSLRELAKEYAWEGFTFLAKENAAIVTGGKSAGNDICYVAQLREYGKHIAFAKNEIIVRIRPGTDTKLMEYIAHKNIRANKHAFIPDQYSILDIGVNDQQVLALQTELKKQNFVYLADVNFVHTLDANNTDDPLLSNQWAIQNNGTTTQGASTAGADMDVIAAWDKTTGDSTIKIGIFDSGVDTLHEDFSGNLLPGFDAFADSTQDTHGYPTPNYSSDGHGTACAGIVAAKGNNQTGIAGVAYSCKIVPVRIFYYQDIGFGLGIQPMTSQAALLDGTAYGWRVAKVDVMITSAGLGALEISFLGINTAVVNAELSEAFTDGRNGLGTPMFFSSGNDNSSNVLWPANLDYVIAVGASSMCDERKSSTDCSSESWGSTYGNGLDVVAPGVAITTTDMTGNNGYNNGNYTNSFNGTSAACPNAAAVGALILSANSSLYALNVKDILAQTAKKLSGYSFSSTLTHGTWNNEVGYGRVDAFEAVKLAETYIPNNSIASHADHLSFSIYPNPTNDMVNIALQEDGTKTVIIRDMQGKEIQRSIVNQDQFALSVYGLAKGIYVVEMHTKNSFGTQKLIVN